MDKVRPCSPESDGADDSVSSPDSWMIAEEATQNIILKVQATLVSEERRRAVVDYVQRLISSSTCCQVFPFGSVPLKTYLPDGDIDLTAVTFMNVDEESLANDVYNVLEREDGNNTAEFVVKDVQIIRAEVKLVKCLVQNIVVDISFNQLGGLSTLCFLEKVSSIIGKNHIFKRSIILIKAWCYYESRVLGAHHGLISTYALETLVLYIFNLFHSSLNGPLAVLYKFLQYFSRFDWDNYCVSLNGPVRISTLPEFVVETSESDESDALLSSDFFRECMENFSVPVRGIDANARNFPPKHLNIVDPLKENNNLGRSVSKGNFYRIRSAFTYGARKLGQILSSPEESVAVEVCNFFSNTLDRHGTGLRPDVQNSDPLDRAAELELPSGITAGFAEISANNLAKNTSFCRIDNGNAVSENRLNGDATDMSTTGVRSPSTSLDTINCSHEKRPFEELIHEGHNDDDGKPCEVFSPGGFRHHHLRSAPKVTVAGGGFLTDLGGEFDTHLNNLHYSRYLYQHSMMSPSSLPPYFSQFLQNKGSWDAIRLSSQIEYRRNAVLYVNPPLFIGPAFGIDEMPKPRGTGAYFTNMNHYKDRPLTPKGRQHSFARSPRSNGRTPSSPDSSRLLNLRHVDAFGKPNSPESKPHSDTNGISLEFGSFKHVSLDPILVKGGRSPNSPSVPAGFSDQSPRQETPKSVSSHDERLDSQVYELKDDDDFPPLSDSNGKGVPVCHPKSGKL